MSEGTAFWEATQRIYREHLKEPQTNRSHHVSYGDLLIGTGAFTNLQEHSVDWQKTYTASEYLKLLQTHSDHRLLDAAHREDFMDAIHRVIADFGGSVSRQYRTVAILAKRV